jgi:sortase (surface protein transpeptidase)
VTERAPHRHRQPATWLAVLGVVALLVGLGGLATEHLADTRTGSPAPAGGALAAPPEDEANASTTDGARAAAAADDGRDGTDADAAADADPGTVADPERVVIPTIDLDVELTTVGLQADGAMELPDFGEAAWYTEGPRPGEVGPAVLVGHLDDQRGPDVFYELEQLAPGDEIAVRLADGSATRFVVEDMEFRRKEALPVERIWGPTDEPALRLITCGGTFDRRTGHYESNLIVYARQA